MKGICALLTVVFVLAVAGQPPTEFRAPPAATAHR